MAQYTFLGSDLVADAGSGTPVFDGGLPATPWDALFPMTGERADSTSPISEFYPLEMNWVDVHKMWHRQKLMAADVTINWDGFIRGGTMVLERIRAAGGVVSDEFDLLLYQNCRWAGSLDVSVGAQQRVISVTVSLLPPSETLRPYYWNSDNVHMLPRFSVALEAIWDDGTEFSMSAATDITVGGVVGSGSFMGDALSLSGSASTPLSSCLVIVTTPASNAYYPWEGPAGPAVDVDTGEPI